MAEAHKIDFNDPASIFDDEEEETLAAIDRGIKASGDGRVVTLEEARERMKQWFTKSSSPKMR